jgi:putative hydrolase of the HAD superfamily
MDGKRRPNRVPAICFDFGDTLVDQGTEVKDAALTTLRGELLPGVNRLLPELKRLGYRLAIVSNGPVMSIPNVLIAHGLYDLFEVCAVSQGLGVEKPDARIFRHALDALGIGPEEMGRTIMVGNDLAADVAGANALGMISVWLNWAPRHRTTPGSDLEVARHTIGEPLELLPLLDDIERQLPDGGTER